MSGLFVLAWVGGQHVAFDATQVEAVVDINMVVPVPRAAAHVLGLASIRSQVLTVIDCGAVVGCAAAAPTGRAIITSVDSHCYALRIDRVDDVVAASVSRDTAALRMGRAWDAVADGLITSQGGFAVVIDPTRLIGCAPMSVAA